MDAHHFYFNLKTFLEVEISVLRNAHIKLTLGFQNLQIEDDCLRGNLG